MNQGKDKQEKRDIVSIIVKIFLTSIFLIGLYFGFYIILLVFAGALLGILLHSLSEIFKKYTKLPRLVTMSLSITTFFSFITGVFWLIIPNMVKQIQSFIKDFPEILNNVEAQLDKSPLTQNITFDISSFLQDFGSVITSFATSTISSFVEILTLLFIIVFIGIYSAIEPQVYKKGIVSLFPFKKRKRISEVYDKVGKTLENWLLGQFFAMLIIGTFTTIALMILDVPYALSLGVLAGLLNFIPNIGPILSVVPTLLISLGEGPEKAFTIIILYVTIQYFESYIITPAIQKRMVHLPPVLILVGEIFFATLAGGLGLFLATPITAVLLVLVQNLYVQDVLEKEA